MGIQVDNRFVVPAPLVTAWATLLDMPRVVPCMPGTTFNEAIDERRFKATARIKVGPVELQFRGEGELTDVDPAAHRAHLKARGNDAKGRGTFQASMAFHLAAAGEATTEVHVDTDLTLSGSVAQYGRGVGLVKEITQQLTTQFAHNLAALIEAERVVKAAAAGRPAQSAPAVSDGPAAPAALPGEPPHPDTPAVSGSSESAAAGEPTETIEGVRVPPATAPSSPVPAVASPAVAPQVVQTAAVSPAPASISGTALLLGALKAMLLRWLGRGR